MPKRFESLEIMKQKSSMSQKVVANKDDTYALYAGAYYQDAYTMAKIDVLLELGLIPVKVLPLAKFYRAYLDRRRKAFFASTCSEISKLGFLLGLKRDKIQVGK